MLLAAIIVLLLSLLKVVDGAKQAKGDVNMPTMNNKTAYVPNNVRFERVCSSNGGANGPPVLKFRDEDRQPIVSMKPRLKVTEDRNYDTNVTTATFLLDPANVDDNAFKQVVCFNNQPGPAMSTSFKLNVIRDESIPSMKINNGSKAAAINDATATLTCSLAAIKSGVVKDYSVGWGVGNLNKTVCVPSENKNYLPIKTKPGPITRDGDMFKSVWRINKADFRKNLTFFCVACMKVGKNSYFDVITQYYDSINLTGTKPHPPPSILIVLLIVGSIVVVTIIIIIVLLWRYQRRRGWLPPLLGH